MARDLINPVLFDVAAWRLRGEREKLAFVPAGGDPSQGGAPPGGGGPPPGADPSQMGMPPADPSQMAGGGGAPALPPQAPPAPAQPGAAPGQPGAAPAKAKIDPAFIYLELSRIRKCVTHMMKSTGIDLPPDVLDDQTVAQVVQGQQPQSQPVGQGQEGAPPDPSLPAMGGQGSISPIQAPDGGGGGGGQSKQSSVASLFQGPVDSDFGTLTRRMDALAALSRSLGRV